MYFQQNIIRMITSRGMRWAGNVACMEEEREKHNGKKPLGRPRIRWEDNIKMDLEIVYEVWTGLI